MSAEFPVSLNDLFAEASGYEDAGRLDEAEGLYREILRRQPLNADALNQWGVLEYRRGRHDQSIALLRAAIALFPAAMPLYHNAGLTCQAETRLAEAVFLYERAEVLRPGNADALCNLGNIHHALSRLGEAEDYHRAALRAAPDSPRIHYNIALGFKARGDREAAERRYRTALVLRPAYADALANLGNELLWRGALSEATRLFMRTTGLDQPAAETQFNLGNLYRAQEQLEAATNRYKASLVINPEFIEAGMSLAYVLKERGFIKEAFTVSWRMMTLRPLDDYAHVGLADTLLDLGAITDSSNFYKKALILNPTHSDALNNLANTQKAQGFLDESVANLARALVARPSSALAHSNLLFTQLYRPETTLGDVFEAAKGWNSAHGRPDSRWPAAPADRDREPRIGFLSADFRTHVVANLVIPTIETLHRRGQSLTLYSSSETRDAMTERFASSCDQLREVAKLKDRELAELVREDGIDILIDLTGHTAGNRMPAMAQRMAPVQATWVGYPATTGIPATDYFLADHGQVPDAAIDRFCEKIIRFPHSYVCYEPIAGTPASKPSPFLRNGFITFGSFNENVKVTKGVLAAWGRILANVRGSRLLFKSVRFDDPGSRAVYIARMREVGLDVDRVDWVGRTTPLGHISAMADADIALDSFPYTGGATTLETLWMGVPVVTLPGETMPSRHACGYLRTLGMTDFIAATADDYVEIATSLAQDRARLKELRDGLRLRMTMSPLCDRHRFTAAFEAAIGEMWRRHCAGEPPAGFDIPAT